MCWEGTRYCRDGRYTACINVHGYELSESAQKTSTLVDPDAGHPQCSNCRPNCYRVVDTLDPADGVLDPAFASGVEYHASGGGLTLAPSGMTVTPPSVDASVPEGSILVPAPEGVPGSGVGAGAHRPAQTDVYLLLDHSNRMTVELQSLYDGWTVGDYLPSGTQCTGGNQTLASSGISGALQCMFSDPAYGVGRFGDIPFDPYSTTSGTIDNNEVAFEHRTDITTNSAAVESEIANVFASQEPTGNPDLATSAIPALHSVATGVGMATGLAKANVPASGGCSAGNYSYPCYRATGDPLLVLVTDAPMHNGPAGYPYAYDAANLTTTLGTGAPVAVPPTNDDFSSVYDMTPGPDASQILATYTGSTSTLSPRIPASAVNLAPACGADDAAADAVFSFDVIDSGSPVPITISTQGTAFQTTLSVHDGPVGAATTLPPSANTNNLFGSAQNLGDLSGSVTSISGNTNAGSISSSYQSAMFGQCGANTLARDALYRIQNGGSTALQVTLDAGTNRGALSVYDATLTDYPDHRWRAVTETSNDLNSSGDTFANVHSISTGAGYHYVTVAGNTSASTIGSNYNQAAFTGPSATCTVAPTSRDAIFAYDVVGAPKTVQFDTEGSNFNTVLALHDALPISNTGATTTTTSDNLNTSVPTVRDMGPVNGRNLTYNGNTAVMTGNIVDNIGCGFDNSASCGDAVYKFNVTQRTTVRMDVTSSNFEPGLMITRAAPSGTQGKYTSFSTGQAHTCAVSQGNVYCWGSNASGQLGGSPGSAGAAVRVTDGTSPLTNIVQVTAGRDHSCAISVSGNAWCWGAGANGRLGAGPSTANSGVALPVLRINSTYAGAVQISAGDAFTCALLRDGRIACWGDDSTGQVGNGAAAGGFNPTYVSGSDTYVMVEAGHAHACAIRASDRGAYCWGNGANGRIGHNSVSTATSPTAVQLSSGGNLTNAAFVSAGGQHSCATTSNGRGYCWGNGANGRLGYALNGTSQQNRAVAIRDGANLGAIGSLRGGWSAGTTHTCATTLEGFILCFGADNLGQLGNDSANTNSNGSSFARGSLPEPVHGFVDGLDVVGNYDHSCALHRTGRLECWGSNGSRQLGNNSTANAFVPVGAQDGGASQNVNFGSGYVDTGFSQTCRSTAQPPEPGCTRRVNPTNGKTYFFCNNSGNSRTWSEAGQTCRSVGMELALPDESGENAWIASNLSSGQSAWIGVARATESNDWQTLTSQRDFVDYNGNLVYDNTQESGTSCFLFICSSTPNNGNFVGPYAVIGLTKSLWGSLLSEPSSIWGNNCVQVTSSGGWRTARCNDLDDPGSNSSCGGLLGFLFCLVGAVLFAGGSILGGAASWLGSSLQLLGQSLAGIVYSSPLVTGGSVSPYVCEESSQVTDLTLDPGEYYITVKGVTGSCEGNYSLQVQDLGSANGGMLACDDNGVTETTTSRLTHTFNRDGRYYLLVKGRNAGDAGNYYLTARDMSVVSSHELACDLGTGSGDPATVTLAPGTDNYVMVKGDAPVDSGPYTLTVRDPSAGSTTLACDTVGNSSLNLNLSTGTYYAVVKGKGTGQQGNYQVTIGGASPTTTTFTPATYNDAASALSAADIRVAAVVSCASGDPGCSDARAQAMQLANDTSGVYRAAATPADVPSEVVAAVRSLESAQRVVALDLIFSPDANPGFYNVSVAAEPDPSNQCSFDSSDPTMRTWLNCAPGASPGYRVEMLNPAAVPVPPGSGPGGSYQFTLRLNVTQYDGSVVAQDLPVYVVPSTAASSGTYSMGSYDQSFDSRGCNSDQTLRPSWSEFTYSADVRPDTAVHFNACTADRSTDLSTCDTGSSSSGYVRFLTVTAGSGTGTSCTTATEATDCGADGFCNTVAGILDPVSGQLVGTCNYLEGADCSSDSDCPGAAAGACRNTGPSFATLGRTCRVLNGVGHPASALDADDGRPVMRVKMDLLSLGTGARTPSVFDWEMVYNCQAVE